MNDFNFKETAMKMLEGCNGHIIDEVEYKINMVKEIIKMKKKMYMVTVDRESTNNPGVEIAGVFDSKEKAYTAQEKVEKWLKENEYDNYGIYVTQIIVNDLNWYEIEESI